MEDGRVSTPTEALPADPSIPAWGRLEEANSRGKGGAVREAFAAASGHRIACLQVQHFVLHGPLREPDADAAAIFLRLSGRVVVQDPADVLARRQALRVPLGMLLEAASGTV